MVALVPRKSKRCDELLAGVVEGVVDLLAVDLAHDVEGRVGHSSSSRCADVGSGGRGRRPSPRILSECRPHGGLPEWPMGADCKSVGLAYEGSNPSPATPVFTAPDLLRSGASASWQMRRRSGRWRWRCVPGVPRRGTASRRRSRPSGVQRTVTSTPSVWPTTSRASSRRRRAGRRRPPGGGAGERQLGADAAGVDECLVGAVGGSEGSAVADRRNLLLFEEGVGGGDRAEDHQRRDRPPDEHEGSVEPCPASRRWSAPAQRTDADRCPPPVDGAVDAVDTRSCGAVSRERACGRCPRAAADRGETAGDVDRDAGARGLRPRQRAPGPQDGAQEVAVRLREPGDVGPAERGGRGVPTATERRVEPSRASCRGSGHLAAAARTPGTFDGAVLAGPDGRASDDHRSPAKIPLDTPPGDPAAIDDVVRSVAGAAHVLAVLAGDLDGPAATAPGVARGRRGGGRCRDRAGVRDLVREVGGAVLIATGHLSAHADRLRDAVRQVGELEPSRTRTTPWPGAGGASWR